MPEAVVKRSFSDTDTGWSFDCETDPAGNPPVGGIVLKNVRHRSNNFARELRLIGIRLHVVEIKPSNGTVVKLDPVLAVLSPSQFTVGAMQELTTSAMSAPAAAGAGATFIDRLKQSSNELVMLRSYFTDRSGNYSGYGVRADYAAGAALFSRWKNCEVDSLVLSQIFLFSTYGKSPPHEPGSVLWAARCHPLTTYSMTANNSVDRTKPYQRVESIRFDYRLHLSLDSVPSSIANPPPAPSLKNNAGLFTDEETVDPIGGFVGLVSGDKADLSLWKAYSDPGGSLTAGQPLAASKAGFAAVEKPLILEVAASGLVKGLSEFEDTTGEHLCWDNIHWWGNRGSGPMISTPGAFHAAHMHWRWGSVGKTLRGSIPVLDTSGRPAALSDPGATLRGTHGTLLVDPRIWIQSIDVAVVRNERELDPNRTGTIAALSRPRWNSLFKDLRFNPVDISQGSDIVCWYSVEAHRAVTIPAHAVLPIQRTDFLKMLFAQPVIVPASTYFNKLTGTVFVHGIFFAHEAEITGLEIGDTGAQYWPRAEWEILSEKDWIREAT